MRVTLRHVYGERGIDQPKHVWHLLSDGAIKKTHQVAPCH